jgi:hypothetical protein
MIFPSGFIGLNRRGVLCGAGFLAFPACATFRAYARKGFPMILAAFPTL